MADATMESLQLTMWQMRPARRRLAPTDLALRQGLGRILGERWNRIKRFAEGIGSVWYVIVGMLVFFSSMIVLGTLRGSLAEQMADVPLAQTAPPPTTVPATDDAGKQ